MQEILLDIGLGVLLAVVFIAVAWLLPGKKCIACRSRLTYRGLSDMGDTTGLGLDNTWFYRICLRCKYKELLTIDKLH